MEELMDAGRSGSPLSVDPVFDISSSANATFFEAVSGMLRTSRFRYEACASQHGSTTVLLHSIAVAHLSERLARAIGWTGHLDELRRAALLHDYFLYDWHGDAGGNGWRHAFLHPLVACENAQADFPDLTDLEIDCIRCHMFPLTIVPPRHREGWIITTADKLCASYETAVRRGLAYGNLRGMYEHFIPDIPISADEVPADWRDLDYQRGASVGFGPGRQPSPVLAPSDGGASIG